MRKLLVGFLIVGIALSAFAGGAKEGAAAATAAVDRAAREAPELAARVAAGELPPLAERLPENPLVVEPLEEIGTYGGVWRNLLVGGDLVHVNRYQGYERLLRWTPEWDGIIPNIAESYTVSPDSRVFTFNLRKGMRWSDGHPFTADDFEFMFEDIYSNSALSPTFPSNLVSGGERGVFTKINDYSFSYTFKEPHGLFLLLHTTPGSLSAPKHYLEQFHINYNPDADKIAKDAGFADWAEMFLGKNDYRENTDYPVTHPWVFTQAPGEGMGNRAIAERNPYYWKVDPDGRQLPYIDRIDYAILADNEVALLRALNGEIDFHDQHIASAANRPVLFDNQDAGNYRFITTTGTAPNAMAIMFNLTHPDPERREIFGNKDFRIGMSHAIDRQEIIDMIYAGEGMIQQPAPRPESDLYNERLAKQYTEFDPAKANEYLDRAGLSRRDSQGFRLMPNGERLIVGFEIDAVRSEFIDGFELLSKYWREVGVETRMQTMDRTLWETRVRTGGRADATIHRFGGGAGSIILTDPRYYFPFNTNSMYAVAWHTWYNNPEGIGASVQPEEPPEMVRRQMALYDQLRVTGEEVQQKKLMREILEIAVEQFYALGVTTEPDSYAIVNRNLVNVPDSMPWNYLYPHPGPTNPETWFYRE